MGFVAPAIGATVHWCHHPVVPPSAPLSHSTPSLKVYSVLLHHALVCCSHSVCVCTATCSPGTSYVSCGLWALIYSYAREGGLTRDGEETNEERWTSGTSRERRATSIGGPWRA